MSIVMVILGAVLFFGGFFAALALESGVAFLLSIIGMLLFVLAGPQRKRERENEFHQGLVNRNE